jgi:hypothetical protein
MLYLLRVKGEIDYVLYDSKLIRARNEKEARRIANERVGDEGKFGQTKRK